MTSCNPKMEILEHTADLAIRIIANDYRELFEYAPSALYSLIGQIVIDTKNDIRQETISLQAGNWEELFHDWLSEILYCFEVREIVFEKCDFIVLKSEHLKANVECGKIDIRKSKIITEIKAVTYHNLKIEQKDEQIEANVIFDV